MMVHLITGLFFLIKVIILIQISSHKRTILLIIKDNVIDIITDLSKDWIGKRDKDKPFFLVIGEKATHREWLPALEDLGSYDDVTLPIPPTFYDGYENRNAVAHQDMTFSETMKLGFDLKVNVDCESDWIYSRLDKEQRAAYRAYYGRLVLILIFSE